MTTPNWLLKRSETKYSGDFVDPEAHLIVAVAKKSPAAVFGIEAGDYLVSIQSKPPIAFVPIELLHDETSIVARTLELEVSPVFYLLNRQGKILYEGELNRDFDYWQALSTAAFDRF